MLDLLDPIAFRLDLIVIFWVLAGSVLLLALSVFFFWGLDSDFAMLGIIFSVVVLIVAGTGGAISAFPYDTKYWHVYHASGTVETVTNGFVDGTGDITGRDFVFTLEGSDEYFTTSNTRITQLEGRDIDLTCRLLYTYEAADRATCSIRAIN